MSEEKHSRRVLEFADEAGRKFDYFMTGLPAAVVSYLAPRLQPTALGLNPQTLELVSMLLFVASVFAGLKRIEGAVRLHRAIGLRHRSSELAANIQDAQRGEKAVISVRTDKITPPDQLKREQAEFIRQADERVQESQELEKARKRWYTMRFWSLVVGFLLLLAANAWKGYC